MTEHFWNIVDAFIVTSRVVIDRPKDTAHPEFPDMIYPVDYGYLAGTTSGDGGGIDVWMGSSGTGRVEAVVCTLDEVKRDAEINLLLGCSDAETKRIVEFLEQNALGCLLVRRSNP
jgi:inorganic pyrophosphatase